MDDEPVSIETREHSKLSGLRAILNGRKIERKVMARQLDIDLNRFLGIVGGHTRANPEEIDRIIQTLGVSLRQLQEPDTSPSRSRRLPIAFADEPSNGDDDEIDRPPPGAVILNLTLPDGRTYTISSNQSPSTTMLQRMTNALTVLLGEGEDK